MWGVSKPDLFTNWSYDYVFGIAASSKQYFPWADELKHISKHNEINMLHFFTKKAEIDVLLDCDKKELKICIVGKCDKWKEAHIWNIGYIDEKDIALGFVPHINLHAMGAKCRIAKIPVEWFGIEKDFIF